MITTTTYSPAELNTLYTTVEEAATTGTNLFSIDEIIHPGDFYLVGSSANGLVFTFDGLIWEKDGVEYDVLLQPQIYKGEVWPIWKAVITRALNGKYKGSSSGITEMIRKEYRKKKER